MFGLREVLYLRPAELDPSAKSRVLYAIEVVKEPVLAIFDQPENNYNENDRYYLFNILNKLKEDRDSGFLIYTRSRSLIEKWGDALYLLKDGLLSSPVDKRSFLLSWR